MKLYRFSPMKTEHELMEAIHYLHIETNKLCYQVMGKYLKNAGNIGVFCHYEGEYEALTEIRKRLTKPSDNPNQKYFELHNPIVFGAEEGIPEAIYTHLYIRKPDPYRHHVGDVDFEIPHQAYELLKQRLEGGEIIPHARLFPRPDLDMVELYHPDIDVLPYISAPEEADKAHTNLGYSNL